MRREPGEESAAVPERVTDKRSARALLRRAARAAPAPRAALVLASLVLALATLALPYALGRAVDSILGGAPAGAGPFAQANNPFPDFNATFDFLNSARDLIAAPFAAMTWVQAAVVLLGLVAFGEAAVAYASGTTNARVTAWLRHRIVGHAAAVGPALTRAIPAGDLVSRGTGNAAQAGAGPANRIEIWTAAVPSAGATVMLFGIDVWCGAVFLAGLLALSGLLAIVVNEAADVTEHYQDAQGRVGAALTEALAGSRTIAAAGTVEAEARRALAPLPAMRHHGFAIWRAQCRSVGQATLLVPMLEVVVLAVAGWQLQAGQISVGQLLAASAYVVLAADLVSSIGAAVTLAQAQGAARRCAAVLAVPAPPYGDAPLPPGTGILELSGVCVCAGDRPVLHDVTVRVPGGSTVAVVGRSGSGKSTLAGLPGRLVDPTSGEVRLDGVDVRELAEAELHRAVTYAFARPALLGRTVGGTIRLGVDRPSREVLEEAARDACAESFVGRLPYGFDTPVAWAPLSGGEAQRLGIARAFAHAGRLLVLDDATSSLDTLTEHQVSAALTTRHVTRTRLIVTHRTSTAARADLVLWLEDGRVRGFAPHAALWADRAYRAVYAAEEADPEGPEEPLVPAVAAPC